MASQNENIPPSSVTAAVFAASEAPPEGSQKVKGVEFNDYKDRDITAAELVDNMSTMGFQASSVGEAARVINQMVRGYCGLQSYKFTF